MSVPSKSSFLPTPAAAPSLFWLYKLPPGVVPFQLPLDGAPLKLVDGPNYEWGTIGQLVAPRDAPLVFGPFSGEGHQETQQRLELEAAYDRLRRQKQECEGDETAAIERKMRDNEDLRCALRQFCHYRPYARFFTEVLMCEVCKVEISDFAFKVTWDQSPAHAFSEELLENLVQSLHQHCDFNFRFRYDPYSKTITLAHHQFSRRKWSEQTITDLISKALGVEASILRVRKVPPLLHVAFPSRQWLEAARAAIESNVYLCDFGFSLWYGSTRQAGAALSSFTEVLASAGNRPDERAILDQLRKQGLPRRTMILEQRHKLGEGCGTTNRVSDIILKQHLTDCASPVPRPVSVSLAQPQLFDANCAQHDQRLPWKQHRSRGSVVNYPVCEGPAPSFAPVTNLIVEPNQSAASSVKMLLSTFGGRCCYDRVAPANHYTHSPYHYEWRRENSP